MKKKTQCFGASVRGPLHQKEGRPNEDAWLRIQKNFGTLAVVCDGMGSRSKARFGAKMACKSLQEAVQIWSQGKNPPLSYLAHLVEVLWRIHISPESPEDCSTTCLFALYQLDGRCILGGIGDGLVAYRSGEGAVQIILGNRKNGFSNETTALGVSKGSRFWTMETLETTPQERIILLATDGISDDLVFEKLEEFITWVISEYLDLAPYQRWQKLCSELRQWPTPKHLDDKTLAVIWSPKET